MLHFWFSGASYKIHFPQVHLVARHLLPGAILLRITLHMKYVHVRNSNTHASVEEQDMFWENVFTQWFTAWPERAVHYPRVPLEQELSDLQQALLKFAIQHSDQNLYLCKHYLQRDAPDIVHIEQLFPSQETNKTVSMKQWWHIFVDVEVRNIVLDGVSFLPTMPQKWTTSKQEEFLTSMFAEYLEHTTGKRYEEFTKKLWKLMNRSALPSVFRQITTRYRWRKNPAHLGRTSGVKGVLKFDTVLAGGVELKGTRAPHKMDIYSHEYYLDKVKDTADTEIRVQDVTDRGPKLNKCREVTHCMYPEESEEVKYRIKRKYQKARAKHAKACLHLKTGRLPQIDNKVKIKAICELGQMLDWILKYLAYATVQERYLCSTVQAAFLTFVKDALTFESILPQDLDVEEEKDSSSDSNNDSDEEQVMSGDDLLPNIAHPISTSSMYRMTPQSESSVENLGDPYMPLSRDASLMPGLQLPSDSHFNSFNNHDADPSVFDHDTFIALINNLNFDISILDNPPLNITQPSINASNNSSAYPEIFLPPVPPATPPPINGSNDTSTYPQVSLPLVPPATTLPINAYTSAHPQVFLPLVPPATIIPVNTSNDTSAHPDIFLPPVPPATPLVGGSETQDEAPTLPVNAETRPCCGKHPQQLTAPTSANQFEPLPEGRRRVQKPLNARERDNNIGRPTKHA
ncbi:hypothetical protein F4604DRAFT_1688760 [Suillus subluteus]|nr:hypothetical protein F4604DRAFT_1688760 [Suillus subluteus]